MNVVLAGIAPWWISTTIALTPCASSTGTSAFAVATSSVNSSPATPAAVTMLGVSLSVMPMKPILAPLKFLIQYGGRIVWSVPSYFTLAERYWKFAPAKLPSGQLFWLFRPSGPSSMQPPFCIRCSSW